MKKRLALLLRRLADKLHPAHLRSYSVTDTIGEPLHVDLRFSNRHIIGYVVPDHTITYIKDSK